MFPQFANQNISAHTLGEINVFRGKGLLIQTSHISLKNIINRFLKIWLYVLKV